jgi:chromosome segregation ATPase
MSITHINERTTPPQNDYEGAQEAVERAVVSIRAAAEPISDRRDRLGSALEEIRTMGSELDEARAVAAERASTIRELHAHVDYLDIRIEKLETELGSYTRMAVALAQQQKAIATLCEEGRRLAAAAAEVHEAADEA